MRITIVNQFYLPDISPTAQLSGSLAEHRAARGDVVTVVCGRGSYTPGLGETGPAGGANGPRVVRLWTPFAGKGLVARAGNYLAFLVQAAVKLLTMPRQDVVIAMTTPPFVVAAALLHKLANPCARLVLWNMDSYPEVPEMTGHLRRGSWASRGLRAVNRFVFRHLDMVVALDEAMARSLIESYAPRRGGPSVRVVPNWERAEAFAPPRAAEPADAGDRFVVLYLGNAGNAHDFAAVVGAAELLRHEPVAFRFVGGGVKWAELERARRERGLSNLLLQGYVPKGETAGLMAGCGAALITLRDEAVGLVSPSKLHSYLACGLPVLYVGPAGSNVDEALGRRRAGFSLRSGDAAGLADAVRRLRSDAGLRAELRRNARAAFEADYCDARTLPRWDGALASLVGGPRAGRAACA